MDINILKQNITQVINSPRRVSYNGEILPNGISSNNTIGFKHIPEDVERIFFVNDELANNLLKSLPEKYRDHLVTIRPNEYFSASYLPVFDTDTQAMWNDEYAKFMEKKAYWISRWGSE